MNDLKILEIAKEVGFGPEFTSYSPGEPADLKSLLLRDFAKAIIQECINSCEQHAKTLESYPKTELEMYDDGIVNGIYEAVEAIRDHFEVE